MDHSHHHHDKIGHTTDANTPHHTMGHSMSFHFGTMETILFDFWKTETAFGIIISCIITMLIAFLMETIRFFRNYRSAQQSLLMVPVAPEERLRFSPKLADPLDPILQFLQLTLAYFLMLIFMTFNIWLCIFTVVGEVISLFLYRTLFPYLNVSMATGHC